MALRAMSASKERSRTDEVPDEPPPPSICRVRLAIGLRRRRVDIVVPPLGEWCSARCHRLEDWIRVVPSLCLEVEAHREHGARAPTYERPLHKPVSGRGKQDSHREPGREDSEERPSSMIRVDALKDLDLDYLV